MTQRAFTCTVGAAGGGSAPTWFVNQTSGTWGTVAGSVGQRLTDVIQSPNSSNPPGGWGNAGGILNGYTGGQVDQIARDYLITAGGGHGDGANNSAYALSLGDAVPAWKRQTDCTPDSQLGNLNVENDGKFDDGRPRPMHASNGSWIGGTGITSRVLFPMMSSVTSGPGGHADWVLSLNRSLLSSTPLAWTGSNIGPWTFHGRTGANTNFYGFGGSVFDDVTNQVFAFANAGGSAGYNLQRIPVTGASAFQSFNTNAGSPTIIPSWMTIASELGIIIIGEAFTNRIAVYTIATGAIAFPATSGTGYWAGSAAGCVVGAAYVRANHKIAVADPHQTNGTIYVATMPMTGSAYNPSGTWVWTTITPSGGPVRASFNGPSDSSEFACNKWNLVKDMGNGQSAIVFVASISGPTFVYKVPLAGL